MNLKDQLRQLIGDDAFTALAAQGDQSLACARLVTTLATTSMTADDFSTKRACGTAALMEMTAFLGHRPDQKTMMLLTALAMEAAAAQRALEQQQGKA